MVIGRMSRVATWKWTILFMISTSVFSAASGVSAMDCSKVKTPTEQTICSDPDLEKMDRQLNRDYRYFREEYQKKGNHDCLLEDEAARQKAWLRERDACGIDVNCLKFAYADRINLIRSYASVCVVINDASEKYLGRACYKPALLTAPEGNTCEAAYRIDYEFLHTSEGGLFVQGYVPGYYTGEFDPKRGGKIAIPLRNPDKKAGKDSGVTIGVGVDLGQQDAEQLRNLLKSYTKEHGNPGQVGIDALVYKLSPFMKHSGKPAPRGERAYQLIKNDPFYLTKEQSEFLTNAVKDKHLKETEKLFNDHNSMGVTFKQLPLGAQTALLDFTYQYSSGADEIHVFSKHPDSLPSKTRRVVWEAVYSGNWKTLANRLTNNDLPDRRFVSRRRREGQLLETEIKNGTLPPKGSPCSKNDRPKQTALFNSRRFFV